MYISRCEKLLRSVKDIAEGVLITSAQNLFYLSGFTGGEGYALITADKRVLFVDSRYTLQAREEAGQFRVEEFRKSALISISEQSRYIKNLAFEDKETNVFLYNRMKEALSCELVPLGDTLLDLRKIKSVSELSKITEAVRLADSAFDFVIKNIKAGMRECDVALIIETYMKRNGAQKPSFDIICASGARSALPHGTASTKQLQKGDFLVMDYGCVLDGYCSDITRTVVIGKADARQREIYNVVLYAQGRTVDIAEPFMQAKDLDKCARDIINNFGYGDNFGHALGHGVGIEVHEKPVASPSSVEILDAGSVVTVEPGIYIDGFGGVRIEDMIYIDGKGHAVLTKSTKEMIEV